jgi:predicted dehydrogenase
MADKVRWAILGAGKIAHSFAKDFSVVENAELVAVAASDKSRAETFAKEYRLPFAFNYEELYNSPEVDAVYIATTHNFHYEQCLQCMKHGKSVLCEKPITLNDKQFKKLANLSKERQVFLMEAMWTYFLPPLLKAKQWLAEGRIGNLKVIEANFGFPMPKNPEGRLYNINLAGGALLDLGVYPVAFSTYFTSEKPSAIVASGVLTDTGVDERSAIILQYENTTASLFSSLINIMANKGMLYGDKGYIEIPDFFKASTAFLYDNEHNVLEKFEDDRVTKGYNFETQHATGAILQGEAESGIMTHAHSNIIQEIMTEVRKQIGVAYPGE